MDAYTSLLRWLGSIAPTSEDCLLRVTSGAFEPLATRILDDLSKSAGTVNLILELLWDVTPSDFDQLSITLLNILQDCSRDVRVVITTSSTKPLDESLITSRRLIPLLEEKHITLIVQPASFDETPHLVVPGILDALRTLPLLEPSPLAAPAQELSAERVMEELDVVFGHFEVNTPTVCHIPAFVSLRRLRDDAVFLSRLRQDVVSALPNGGAIICSGMRAVGLQSLARAALGTIDELSIMNEGQLKESRQIARRPVIILNDLYCSTSQFDSLVKKLQGFGASPLEILSVASLKNVPVHNGIVHHYYVTLPYPSYFPAQECRMCKYGDDRAGRAREVSSLRELEDNFGRFDTVEFWELIGSNAEFYDVSYWASDRTRYHYHFRLLTLPLLKQHSYALTIRLRNCLRETGIVPAWIRKVICPSEPEAEIIARSLAQCLNLDKERDVISIPREKLRMVVGRQVPDVLQQWIVSDELGGSLQGRNVVIVDQAAHHFSTYAAIAAICRRAGATVLAYCVLIDRTPDGVPLGDYVPDVHYVSLYSWNSPPVTVQECPCTATSHIQSSECPQ